MRIAMVAPLVTPIREPQLGGSQALLADLAQGLKNRGHAVDVYAASGSVIPGVTVVDTGVRAESLADLFYRADGSSAAEVPSGERAFRTVFDAISDVAYDLVHNHAFDLPAVRLGVALRSPVVHTLHLPPDRVMAAALNDALQSTNPPIVAVVSASVAAGWRELTRVDVVLRNGVPVDRIPWSRAGGGGLLFAGRFSAEKGADDAIAIARRAGVSIHLYGEPYDPEYTRKEIEPHRGDPGVTVHGGVTRAELWQVMSVSSAILCPVKWEEPFGMVAAEAQAAGAPVIAYRRGALPEIIIDRKTGILVGAGDVTGAAAAVGEVAAIKRSDCRQHAEMHLNLDATLSTHERLYERAVAATANKRHG